MVVRVTNDNYAQLKQVFGWMTENALPLPPGFPLDAHPIAALELSEVTSPARARQGLAMALGDLLEATENLEAKRIGIIDQALEEQSLPTWSSIRLKFSRKLQAILARGRVRSETEYYALRNVVESMEPEMRVTAWAMLSDFEERNVRG
ncbi:hypothetical protein [Parasphingopyxis marina]|uniref:Uncharacterized protein n=1 Tax=Parasphingopyxis marina TaxID=2761622 RepID=A0A842HW81_9SPHN|nr:hypothetical protein [Parasphingopyxis marina]MBC2776200.1 hypothetical protein [Parasphingopyxis marina]